MNLLLNHSPEREKAEKMKRKTIEQPAGTLSPIVYLIILSQRRRCAYVCLRSRFFYC